MLVYKLTDQDNRTCNDTLWGENISHKTNGLGPLCSWGWLHFYTDPYVAILMNPVHANLDRPKLWEAEAQGQFLYDGDAKGGCTHLMTLREIPVPEITLEQRVRFAILCTKAVSNDSDQNWLQYANDWLRNRNRRGKPLLTSMSTACYAERPEERLIAYCAATTANMALRQRMISLVAIAHEAISTQQMATWMSPYHTY